jgi:hypothetical protein
VEVNLALPQYLERYACPFQVRPDHPRRMGLLDGEHRNRVFQGVSSG